jgi:hypothetical protein
MFQRRHYEAIAAVISARPTQEERAAHTYTSAQLEACENAWHDAACRIAFAFSRDNPNFDRARFLKACGFK